MKKIKLNLLLEQVVNDIINRTHYLKPLVDKYKYIKVGGQNIIEDSDFNSLLEYTLETKPYIDKIYTHSKAYLEKIPYNSPIKRVFNFYQNLQFELSKQNNEVKDNVRLKLNDNDKRLFQGAINDIISIVEYGFSSVHKGRLQKVQNTGSTNQEIPIQPIVNIKFPLEHTKFLKNRIGFYDANQNEIKVTDNDFAIFDNQKNQNITYVYDSIMSNDKNLNLPTNTPEGKVYNLWKGLKYSCQDKMVNYVNLLRLSGVDPNSKQATNNKTISKELTDTQKVNLKALNNDSDIELTYDIYSSDLRNILYTNLNAIFDFYHLRRNFELVNKSDKNNYFIFNHPIPADLETGRKYFVKYYSSNEIGENLYLKINGIKTKTVESFTQFKDCNAADELKKLLYSIRNN